MHLQVMKDKVNNDLIVKESHLSEVDEEIKFTKVQECFLMLEINEFTKSSILTDSKGVIYITRVGVCSDQMCAIFIIPLYLICA